MIVVKVLRWINKVVKDKALQKTIVYRIIGVTTGFLISYGIFRTLEICLALTASIELVHSVLYYVMEKYW